VAARVLPHGLMEASPGRETGSGRASGGPERPHLPELNSEQALLLDVIASVADALGLYGAAGEERWTRVRASVATAGSGDLTLRAAMRGLAGSVAADSSRGGGEAARAQKPGVVCHVAVATGSYRLRAIRLRPGFFGTAASVLVVAEQLPQRTPDRQRLNERFGLTAREADVSLLLAQRRSNAEIARVLGISPHTARRHTEQVLLKLGAKRRQEVERILHRATAAEDCAAEEEP
jgi:DNA-binding CsgD family transcriptional regulator